LGFVFPNIANLYKLYSDSGGIGKLVLAALYRFVFRDQWSNLVVGLGKSSPSVYTTISKANSLVYKFIPNIFKDVSKQTKLLKYLFYFQTLRFLPSIFESSLPMLQEVLNKLWHKLFQMFSVYVDSVERNDFYSNTNQRSKL